MTKGPEVFDYGVAAAAWWRLRSDGPTPLDAGRGAPAGRTVLTLPHFPDTDENVTPPARLAGGLAP